MYILVALLNTIIQTHILHKSGKTIKINNKYKCPPKPVFYTNHTGFLITLSTLFVVFFF